jgi:micrococcal nuclease
MYEYQASPGTVVDGDTIEVTVDLGFRIHRKIRLRLTGVDTHEIHGVDHDSEEYRRGKAQKEFVEEWLDDSTDENLEWPLFVRTEKTGKYGRYLAEIERKFDGAVLNDALVDEFGDVVSS